MADNCIFCNTPIYWGQPNVTIYSARGRFFALGGEVEGFELHRHGSDPDCKYERKKPVYIQFSDDKYEKIGDMILERGTV